MNLSNIKIDEFLEIIKDENLNLNDIKNLFKTNNHVFSLCNDYKNIIFRDVIYILQFTYREHQIDDFKFNIIGTFKNINHAITRMKIEYDKVRSVLEKKMNDNNRYTFNFTKKTLYCELEEDNGIDEDQSFNWKIKAIKLI